MKLKPRKRPRKLKQKKLRKLKLLLRRKKRPRLPRRKLLIQLWLSQRRKLLKPRRLKQKKPRLPKLPLTKLRRKLNLVRKKVRKLVRRKQLPSQILTELSTIPPDTPSLIRSTCLTQRSLKSQQLSLEENVKS